MQFLRIVLLSSVVANFSTGVIWDHNREAQASDTANAATLDSSTKLEKYGELPGLTAEEKAWFVKFQEGNFLVDGWQDISAYILAQTPESQRTSQRELLKELGEKIGLEWCKGNDVRKVDNSMLREWGRVLKKTASDNPELLSQVLASINSKVDKALQN